MHMVTQDSCIGHTLSDEYRDYQWINTFLMVNKQLWSATISVFLFSKMLADSQTKVDKSRTGGSQVAERERKGQSQSQEGS